MTLLPAFRLVWRIRRRLLWVASLSIWPTPPIRLQLPCRSLWRRSSWYGAPPAYASMFGNQARVLRAYALRGGCCGGRCRCRASSLEIPIGSQSESGFRQSPACHKASGGPKPDVIRSQLRLWGVWAIGGELPSPGARAELGARSCRSCGPCDCGFCSDACHGPGASSSTARVGGSPSDPSDHDFRTSCLHQMRNAACEAAAASDLPAWLRTRLHPLFGEAMPDA